jgi:hypothetical protein
VENTDKLIGLLKDLKVQEEKCIDIYKYVSFKIIQMVSLWNELKLGDRVFIEDGEYPLEFSINDSLVITYKWDEVDLNEFIEQKSQSFKLPLTYVNNYEWYVKHKSFILELYKLQKEYEYNYNNLSNWYDMNRISKLIGDCTDLNVTLKDISKLIRSKCYTDPSSDDFKSLQALHIEHKKVNTLIKEYNEEKTKRVDKIVARINKSKNEKRIRRINEINVRINTLNLLLGEFKSF